MIKFFILLYYSVACIMQSFFNKARNTTIFSGARNEYLFPRHSRKDFYADISVTKKNNWILGLRLAAIVNRGF